MTDYPRLFDSPEFDAEQSARARADGIARAEEHANEQWKLDASAAVETLADTGQAFTADEVWALLAAEYGSETHEPSALGPVFLKASRAKKIIKTGRLRPSKLARRHRDLTEWVGR